MKIIPVEHMDEVLRAALRIEDPEIFLREPSRAVDWRKAERTGDGGARPSTPSPTVPEPAQPEPH